MTGARLYLRFLQISVRGQVQYRTSFFLQTLGQLLMTGGEFLGIWALVARFGTIRGWELAEVAVFYGVMSMALAVADAVTTGFDRLGTLVQHGLFDRYLLRPRSTVLQLLGYEFTLRRAGRLLQGATVLTYGLIHTSPFGTPFDLAVGILLVVWAVAGASAFFVGLFMIQATMAFKTVEALEIMNIFTYGGAEAGQYPFSIYVRWFRRLFTFVVPLGAVSYYPVVTVLGRPDPLGAATWVGWVTPAAGVLFLAVALLVWHRGVRWYTSTGS